MSDVKTEFFTLLNSLSPALFPEHGQAVKTMHMEENALRLSLPFVCNSLFSADSASKHAIDSFAKQHSVELKIEYDIPSIKGQNPKVVKNIIAVASGKGGVGKSTTAVNLAGALSLEGARVGILDADVYGPSLPTLLGTKNTQPESPDNKHIYPIVTNNLQSMSIGYLVDDDSASIWRGPMASKAFQQLFNETLWQELDYLIVDMPPGTGDIQLTLAQSLPVTAALIVTTPQDLALADAIKGIAMFNKVNIPVLGIVENMSYHICSQCGHKEHLFGADGGQRIAQKYATQLLAQLPLTLQIRELADNGDQLMFNEEADVEIKQVYRQLAQSLSYKISLLEATTQQIGSRNVG
ncbi:MAG: ATP-binding protein involved in chromosome partitioning [Paraglaciecola sp.]|jgi:ATP-binding protein involved in chromosome partitioning